MHNFLRKRGDFIGDRGFIVAIGSIAAIGSIGSIAPIGSYSATRYSATVVLEGCDFEKKILFIYIYKYSSIGNEQGGIFYCSTVARSAPAGLSETGSQEMCGFCTRASCSEK